jgi:hypothetical protein
VRGRAPGARPGGNGTARAGHARDRGRPADRADRLRAGALRRAATEARLTTAAAAARSSASPIAARIATSRQRRRTAATTLVGGRFARQLAAWLFSSRLLEPDHEPGPYGTAVERVEARDLPGGGAYRVTFERDDTSSRPGLYGLDYPGGHAIAREIVAASDAEVTRRVTDVRGELEEGVDVAFDAAVWEGDPLASRGIPFLEIDFRSQLGLMPAWQVGGRGRTWAIFVHGHNATRHEGLRVLPTLRRAGLPTLLIAYRNDPGAPPSEDGLIRWRLKGAVNSAGAVKATA